VTLSHITGRTPPPKKLDELGPTCSIEEASELLGIGRNYGYELARRNELPGLLHLGRRLRVSTATLKRYLSVDEECI